ncbi:hypothetical protein ACQP1K_06880 [Sphaerimonospora sp. CA-214678]|uniref:hypothetical protein n=1 Tax=Sphaerimonospora sp. CA-214678 TaxID=3240029 RepID=UPI003D8DCA3F
MKRPLGYTLAWCGATALAVGLSWLGVRDVLHSAILDDAPLSPVVAAGSDAPSPGPLPTVPTGSASSGASDAPAGATPEAHTPRVRRTTGGRTDRAPSPSPRPPRTRETHPAPVGEPVVTKTPARAPVTADATAKPAAGKPTAGSTTAAAADETLHTFTLRGGRATIAVTAENCRVVTAAPSDGYEVKVWEEPYWLRVAFLRGSSESSAFCTWNALPPRLDTYEN